MRKFRAYTCLSICNVFITKRVLVTQKTILTKQGLKFKLRTKVLSAEKNDGKVVVATEAVKDGKQETVRGSLIPHLLAGSQREVHKLEGVKYNVGRFPFLANLRAKTKSDTEGQVKFVAEEETDSILCVHIIGALPKLPSGVILYYLRS